MFRKKTFGNKTKAKERQKLVKAAAAYLALGDMQTKGLKES